MGRPFVCAGSESRTRTPLLAYAPETYASTNSAIPAKDVSKAGAKISGFLSSAKFFFKTVKNFFSGRNRGVLPRERRSLLRKRDVSSVSGGVR